MATQILPGIYLGDMLDARTFEGGIVTVHEEAEYVPPRGHWIPILKPYDVDDEHLSFEADRTMLDAAALVIRAYVQRGEPVLVHCGAGIERSPLTLIWYLKKYQHFKSLNAALTFVQEQRPVVMDRLMWLNPRSKE